MATSFNGGSEIQENENKEIGVSKEGALETSVNMGLVNRQQY